MASIESEPGAEAAPAEDAGHVAAGESPGPSGRFAARPVRLGALALAAGVTAGLVAWLGGEAAHGTFAPPAGLYGALEKSAILAREQLAAQVKNAALAFGLLGAATGLALGVVGGLARRSTRASAGAGLVGLVAGLAAGAATSLILVPIGERDPGLAESLFVPLLMHGGIWSAVGAAGGLAFGLGLGGRGMAPRALLGGLSGALLGTIGYELVGALVFPLAGTSHALSATAPTRLLACLFVTIPVALCAGRAVLAPPARASSASR